MTDIHLYQQISSLPKDLILLQVDYHSNEFIKMADTILQPGEKIFAIGSPVGLSKTISEGMISGTRNFEERKLLQITAPISHGSMGIILR